MLYSFNLNAISEKLRPGQRGAIAAVLERRRNNEAFTSIVLPTRYGKSDVVRLSALQMIRDGLVSNALIVVPARNLVEQMLDYTKLTASALRYGFPVEAFWPVQTINSPPRIARLREAKMSAITTSMANLHTDILTRWVDMMLGPSGPGVPPVVYMDEAHLGSDGNRWGNISRTLAKAGAYVVVLTATPFRSDGQPIPGFEVDRVVLETMSDGREKVIHELEPHWETTLPEAMEEDPPPVAGITYQPFGIAGRLDDMDDAVTKRVILDDLSDAAVRRAYRESLRDPAIMESAIRFFLTELRNRRMEPRQAGTSGIVFVGNHEEEFDQAENAHARNVQALLRKLSPGLRCEVIVSSDPSAQNLLDEFIAGKVDVAIVKQMGAVGLDVDHLKVALDLSNTRSRAYFHQRMMRITTRWDVPGYPDNPVMESTYIAPDDRITRGLVDSTLKGTGLLRVVTTGTQLPIGGDVIDVPPIDLPPEPTFIAEKVVLTGDLQDSDGVKGPAAYTNVADDFSQEFPGVAGSVPKARLINWLRRAGANPEAVIRDDDVNAPPTDSGAGSGTTLDMTKALDAAREECHTVGKKAINLRFKREFGNYTEETKNHYGRIAGIFWSEQFEFVGLPRRTRLETIDDVNAIRAITANVQRYHLKEE